MPMLDFEEQAKDQHIYTGREIQKIDLLPQLEDMFEEVYETCEYFFAGKYGSEKVPFRGFIFLGPPGTGKTELGRQVSRELDERLRNAGIKVKLCIVDGASIAAPKWGRAEKNIRDIFSLAREESSGKSTRTKAILLFDDIESLILSRGEGIAEEWHYSINSILFHELDEINPSEMIVIATSNKPEMVDDAILSRLHKIEFPLFPLRELMYRAEEILSESGVDGEDKEKIKHSVKKGLEKIEKPTLRDVEHYTTLECIERGVWK